MQTIFLILSLLMVFVLLSFLVTFFWIGSFGAAPFVPTPMKAVKKLLEAADIKKGEKVYDLGAGDGRFIHLASKNYGANAIGFELNIFIYFLAKIRQWIWKWEGTMKRANIWKEDLSDADVIICYLLPRSLAKHKKKFEKELKKGSRIISYAFSIKGLEPKKVIAKEKGISKIILYEI